MPSLQNCPQILRPGHLSLREKPGLNVPQNLFSYFNGIANEEDKQTYLNRLKDGEDWEVKRRIVPSQLTIG